MMLVKLSGTAFWLVARTGPIYELHYGTVVEIYDLNDFVNLSLSDLVVLQFAFGINNSGQIVGYGLNSAGLERAFL